MNKEDYICQARDCSECHSTDCWQDHLFCDRCGEEISRNEDRYEVETEYRNSKGKWVKDAETVCENCNRKDMKETQPIKQSAVYTEMNAIKVRAPNIFADNRGHTN